MAERVLTSRELNRALLARQFLLERVELPLPRALERLGGIQDQYAPNGYIRLWSCLDGFERDDLDREYVSGGVVQATSLRGTIHLLSPRDFALFAAGIARTRRAWWERSYRPFSEFVDLDAAAEAVRELLGGSHRGVKELTEALSPFVPPGAPANIALAGVQTVLPLVRMPPSGTWAKRRANLFGLAEDTVPPVDATEDEGLEHLARRYLEAFGPATRKDLASWAGVPARDFEPVLERIRLRRFRDEGGAELLDLPGAPLPDPETPAPVRFLPTFDATLLVHTRRTGILPEQYRPLLFTNTSPQSFTSFLVDGVVAGTWRYEDGRILIEPYEPLPAAVRRELDDEAERLAAFHA